MTGNQTPEKRIAAPPGPPAVNTESIVPAVEPRGGHPAEVQEAEDPHEPDRAQGALPLPLAGGGGDAQAERPQPPAALQPAAQLDVLHQRDLGVAADRLEIGAAHEDRLIAGADAGGPGARVHEPGDHPEERALVVE